MEQIEAAHGCLTPKTNRPRAPDEGAVAVSTARVDIRDRRIYRLFDNSNDVEAEPGTGQRVSEATLLLSIHGLSSPFLDMLFRLSHEIGTLRFCAVLVLAATAWHGLRGERREALAWLGVGLATLILFLSLKPAFARPRPELWPRLVGDTGFSFPSGHALASATFYPLLAWVTLRLRRAAFALVGIGLPLFIGFGRLYLGVHWPTDVLAGWALGAAQAAAALRCVRHRGREAGDSGLLVPTRRLRKSVLAVTAGAVVLGAAWATFRPDRAIRVATGFVSHVLCSNTFVSGLNPDQVYAEALKPMRGMAAADWALRHTVDSTRREVRTTFAGAFASRAVFREGRGCTLVRGETPPEAMLTRSTAPEAPTPEPLLPPIAGSSPVDPTDDGLRAALDRAFAEPDHAQQRRTKAVVVVQNGRVVAERHAPGYRVDTPLLGWSVTKSVTNALVGVLVRQGRLSVEQPAPVPAWRDPSDPRHAITIDHLLRMTSGLALDETRSGFDPASQMLFLEPDMAGFAERASLQARPGSAWKYTSGNTLILSRIIRDAVGSEEILRFASRELFEPLGMRSTTLELDAAGTPVGSTCMLASARDWARFGMLFLNDGVVGGRRILPEGWVRYSSSPTLDAGYGAGFWLGSSEWRAGWSSVPRDAFFASGMLGQSVMVIPSERLVIARFGVTHGDDGMGRLVTDVIGALKGK